MLKTSLPTRQKWLWRVETKLKKPLPISEHVANFLWRVVHTTKCMSQNSGNFSRVYVGLTREGSAWSLTRGPWSKGGPFFRKHKDILCIIDKFRSITFDTWNVWNLALSLPLGPFMSLSLPRGPLITFSTSWRPLLMPLGPLDPLWLYHCRITKLKNLSRGVALLENKNTTNLW